MSPARFEIFSDTDIEYDGDDTELPIWGGAETVDIVDFNTKNLRPTLIPRFQTMVVHYKL